jgi:hypothetical protein
MEGRRGVERGGEQNSNINHISHPQTLPFGLKPHSTTYRLIMNGTLYGVIIYCHRHSCADKEANCIHVIQVKYVNQQGPIAYADM